MTDTQRGWICGVWDVSWEKCCWGSLCSLAHPRSTRLNASCPAFHPQAEAVRIDMCSYCVWLQCVCVCMHVCTHVCMCTWGRGVIMGMCVCVCMSIYICVFLTETVTGMYYDNVCVCVCRYSVCMEEGIMVMCACVCMSTYMCLCDRDCYRDVLWPSVYVCGVMGVGSIMVMCVYMYTCTCFFVAGM